MMLRTLLIAVEIFVGISGVVGGVGLVATDGRFVPLSLLQGTPFSSYFWPGVILAGVVGGLNLAAAYLAIRRHRFWAWGAAVAGFDVQVWIFTEMYLMRISHWLHILYFAAGLLTVVLTLLILWQRNRSATC